ncbi:MAG: hypothetical protein PHO94_13280, partial [Petrimonas sp.]|nr:hypothetical protein [Petrimonas sp.]
MFRKLLIGCLAFWGIAAGFSNTAVATECDAKNKFSLMPDKSWTFSNGMLKTVDNIRKGTARAFIKSSQEVTYKNWELKFKVKVIHHGSMGCSSAFGIEVPGSSGRPITRIFCVRGHKFSVAKCYANNQSAEQCFISFIPDQILAGAGTPWTKFKVVRQDNKITLYVNGEFVGSIENYECDTKRDIGFYVNGVDLWLDDISIKTTGAVNPKKCSAGDDSKIVNMVPNSGFEICTQDGLADYWGCPHWGITDQYWLVNFEKWKKNFGTDTSEFFEGNRSMRIHNPFEKPEDKPNYTKDRNFNGLCLRSCILGALINTDYVLSAYMKSEPKGMKINFAGNEITLSDTWRRYETKFRRNDYFYSDMISIYPLTKGTFWVDAVQLEKGNKASSYVTGKKVGDPIAKGSMTSSVDMLRDISREPILIRSRYSVYSNEREIFCKACINFSQAELADKKLVVTLKDSDNKAVLSQEFLRPAANCDIKINIEKLDVGNYTLDAQLVGEGNKAVASMAEPIRKVHGKPNEVKIDKINHFITDNGKPYFPFGFYWEGGVTDEIIRYLAKSGFNTVVLKSHAPWDLLDGADKVGFKIIYKAEDIAHRLIRKRSEDEISSAINEFKKEFDKYSTHPAYLGTIYCDESYAAGYGWKEQKKLFFAYNRMKEISPLKLVYTNDQQDSVYGWLEYNRKNFNAPTLRPNDIPTDIFSIDSYADPDTEAFSFLDAINKMNGCVSKKIGKPFLHVLLGSGYSFWIPREYTPIEAEFCTYSSIVNGATGILYWANHPHSPSLWE